MSEEGTREFLATSTRLLSGAYVPAVHDTYTIYPPDLIGADLWCLLTRHGAAGLLVVLRDIHVNPGAEPDEMVSVRMWVEESRCISMRVRRLAAMTEVADQLRAGNGPCDAGDLLHEITERLLDRIEGVVHDVEDRTDDLEERVLMEQFAP